MSTSTTTTFSPSSTNATVPAIIHQHGWDAARIFTASVAGIYGTLAIVTLFLFIRKLNQTCQIMNEKEEQERLLNNSSSHHHHHDIHNTSQSSEQTLSNPQDHPYGGGGPGRFNPTEQQYGPASRILSGRGDKQLQSEDFRRYYGGGGAALGANAGRNAQLSSGYHQQGNSYTQGGMMNNNNNGTNRPFAHHRPSIPESDTNTNNLRGPNVNDVTRTSTIGSNLDFYSNNPGVAPSVSDVVVEVRSDAGSDAPTNLTDRGANPSGLKFTPRPRETSRGACMSCFLTCFRPVLNLLAHCCCFPSSYFCDRHRSSLLLLGTMFFYSISRCAELISNTNDFWTANQGAATLYQTVVTAFPASCLLLLQVSFNLKWVTNVRNISASGAPEGSRLSLGPSRSALSVQARGRTSSGIPPDEDDPDAECSCDIGTLSLAQGVFFVFVAPLVSVFGLIAYVIPPTDPQRPQDDEYNYFLGLQDTIWAKIITGIYAIPYTLNGAFCIFLGFVLKTVWKPFSEVAIKASGHMFLVAELWGGLCFVRGILLLSYDVRGFNHASHSPWAGPAVLVAEGTLIYIIVFIFFTVSRNQDQVMAAEKEARKRLERGLGSSSPGSSPSTKIAKAKGLSRPGDNDDDDNNNGAEKITASGRLVQSSSANDLYGDESEDRLRDGKPKKQRRGKGLDAAGGSNLGSANQQARAAGLGGGDGSGLPVYSSWSSHSQTPSRAVSENFDQYNQGPAPHPSGGNNLNVSNSQAGFGLLHQGPSTATLNSSNGNAGGGVMSAQGQPTQSRLFYED